MKKMTREVISKMPKRVVDALNQLRKDYYNNALNADEVRKESYGYTKGLRDAGIITERERQVLFIYTTIRV